MKITRKRFLQGTGAVLALPWLESVSTAATPTKGNKAPLRMGVVTVAGGTVIESWKPKKAGKLEKLPSILRSLQGMKDDLTIVSGLSHDCKPSGNGHQACARTHFTCDPDVKEKSGKAAPTISFEQLVADKIPQDRLFPFIGLGASGGESQFSYKADGSRVPYEKDLKLAFERIFKGRKPVAPNWSKKPADKSTKTDVNKKKSYESLVVDLVSEEAKYMHKVVSASDKQRLDQYLESVFSIERRVNLLEQRLTEQASDLQSGNSTELDLVSAKEIASLDKSNMEKYFNVCCDLMILCFQSDSTRVAVSSLGSDGAQFPGVVTVGTETHAHTLEHAGNARRVEDADPISREGLRQIHEWYTKQFSHMVYKMKMIDEGGTSLLDNTMLLYTSYMANGGHSRKDYPMLLCGNAQGSIKTGQHIACENDTPVANLYLEMINRMGVECGEFGNSKSAKNARYSGKIPGLI